MGTVYKAHDRDLDETVALKVLREDLTRHPEIAERFRWEIKLARRARHRNVCGIHEYGQDGHLRFIAMEFVTGVNLKEVLRTSGALPPREAFDVSIQVAEGLQAIHDEGIVHRDLKTPNLMRDSRGVVRVMDFGIAKEWGGDSRKLTLAGQLVGTPAYMSPEQIRGERIDSRSDIYSLGIVIFELFTGHVPFRGDTPVVTLFLHLTDPPPLEGPAAASLPPALVPILRRALAKEVQDRYPSAGELADALREARRALPALMVPTPPARRPAAEAPELLPEPDDSFTDVPTEVPTGLPTFTGMPAAGPPEPGAAAASAEGLDTDDETEEVRLPPGWIARARLPSWGASRVPAEMSKPVSGPSPPTPGRSPRSPWLGVSLAVGAVIAVGAFAALSGPPTLFDDSTSGPVIEAGPEPADPDGVGFLQLGVRPYAEVLVDGRPSGTTPMKALRLPAGVHTVRLLHPDFEPLQREITVRAGMTTTLDVDLAIEATAR
jgi:serine/threonine protein kinase